MGGAAAQGAASGRVHDIGRQFKLGPHGPALVKAWAIDRSKTTAEKSARRRNRLSDQLVKICMSKSLLAAVLIASKGKARGGRSRGASATGPARRLVVEEVERLRR